jgi:hypothetical protein
LEKETPNVIKEESKMLNENKQVRVLSRMGARELTPEESKQIGGATGTFLSKIRTGGGADIWLDQ